MKNGSLEWFWGLLGELLESVAILAQGILATRLQGLFQELPEPGGKLLLVRVLRWGFHPNADQIYAVAGR